MSDDIILLLETNVIPDTQPKPSTHKSVRLYSDKYNFSITNIL